MKVDTSKLSKEDIERLNAEAKRMNEESVKRQEWIQKHVREYFKAINGNKLNAPEMFALGMDTIIAGYKMVSRFSDMLSQNADERMNTILTVRSYINDELNKTFLNEAFVNEQVKQTAIHDLKANKLIKA